MAYLKVIVGTQTGQTCELRWPKSVLGRHPDCDVSIDVQDASRHHAQILFQQDACFLEDLHSRNGTFLNDRQVLGQRELRDGDRIRISDTVFTFHRGQEVDSRKRETIAPKRIRPVLVDGDRPDTLALLSEHDSDATSRSHTGLQAQLKALLQITQNMRKTLRLDEVLPQILDSLFVIFPPADRGFVVLLSDDGEIVPRWAKLRSGETDEPVPISRTILRRALDAQEAILSADAVDDARFKNSQSLAEVPIRSILCAPLIDGAGRSFGAIQIDTTTDRDRFRKEDLEVLLSVATQASIAIDNARLHETSLRQRAIERDLEVADKIQRSFLPKRPPQLAGYQFYDYYRPANHVGGDFYDYVPLADGRLAVVVADVVGHGLAAAMLSANLVAEVRFHLLSTPQPAEAMSQLNALLADELVEGHFVTLVLAVLSPESGEVSVINAGHTLPIVCTGPGSAENIDPKLSGLPLGVVDATTYEETQVQLPPGGLMAIYTDGINETMDDQKRMYGADRIRGQLATAGSVAEIGRRVIHDVRNFLGDCPQRDDMCLVCFGRK